MSRLLNLVPLYGEAAEEGFAVAALQAVMITDDDQSSIRLRLIIEIPFPSNNFQEKLTRNGCMQFKDIQILSHRGKLH